ncbi:hypothetical protein CCAX7_39520 [Capsulimonas corticalis]|uniref:Xylose isomerase-like TIM barrel domain-containing protein n=1 Tax=Capsulimonas corticalis TaxID=2219043 RepID=A0A402D3F8_9BACT|nr:sugar phosphate isomerase/epimerase family protein [Capsulimonas corticalis]BDI31901.1 hypothetical protein CCAX7_39520 [Capsulimonas corticalis]
MKFGVCAGLDDAAAVARAGFDYLEPGVSSALNPDKLDADVLPVLQRVSSAAGTPTPSFNMFLPGDLKIIGEAVDQPRLEHYVHEAFRRASLVGAEVLVLGSGAARGIPDGFSRAEAERQFDGVLKLCAAAAEQFGVDLAIEALNTGECNFVNSVAEAADFARRCGGPHIGIVSDIYHILMEDQSYEETYEARDLLKHVHVCGGEDRRAPNGDDLTLLTDYFRVLKRAGYDRRISVEGLWESIVEQGARSQAVVAQAWDSA